jgi:hypothetical protein
MKPRIVVLLALILLPGGLAAGCEAPVPEGDRDEAASPLAERLAQARMVDLTHPFGEETLVWPTSDRFRFETLFEGWTEEGYYYAARNFSGPEHGGTHLAAPIPFAEGRWTTAPIPVSCRPFT